MVGDKVTWWPEYVQITPPLAPLQPSFVIFDTEKSCGGKQAEIIQLVAETKGGGLFSRFTTPTKEISPRTSQVNKFIVSWVGGKKILYRGGNILQTDPFRERLRSCDDFFADSKGSCDKIVLIGHNSAFFVACIVLTTIQEYSPKLGIKNPFC